MNRLILLIFLVSASQFLYAQNDFRPGYVVSLAGDTLTGEIDYRGELIMATLCKFRSANQEVIEYSPAAIHSFRFVNSKYYVSREVNSKMIFLEFLVHGKINVYYQRDESGDHYYVDKEHEKLSEIPFKQEIKQSEDGKKYYFESTRHIGFLKYYMSDAPKLQSKIDQFQRPDHTSMINLARDYHYQVCDNEQCIIYEKKQPLFSTQIEIVGGLRNFENVYVEDKNYFQGGFYAHIWMPRTNEKLYFRTGLLASQLQSEEGNYMLYKIPFQIEYVPINKRIQPKMALGFNVHRPIFHSVSYMVGLNVKITKSIFWSVNYDVDFVADSRIPIVPETLFSQSVTTGLLIKFKQ